MQIEAVQQWIYGRRRVLIYVLGSGIVSVWTLLRFFTQRSIFDLVSQQVVVQHWLHGAMSTAHMGQTAYVPKMLLLYVPLDALPGSPRLKLIVLTVAINIATFVLVGVIIEKILREFGVQAGGMFYAALLWLSVVAGSVFWIEFANSRNLEVAGGLWWIYLGLRFLRVPSWRRASGLAALGGLLFFADPLQLYMSALPLLAYAAVLGVTRRVGLGVVGRLFGIAVVSWAVAQVLFALAGHWLHLTFKDTGGTATLGLSASWLLQSAGGVVRALVGLFAGAADAGRLREVANVGLLVAGGVALVHACMHRLLPRRLVALVVCIGIVDVAVYVGSGQAVQGAATARYLVMLAPAAVLALGALRLPRRMPVGAMALVAAVVAINLVALGDSLWQQWDTSFPRDAQLASTYRYMQHNPTLHFYASTDTAMPLLYFDGLPAKKILPVGCLAGKLVRTHFSMDAAFARNANEPSALAAIVFDGDSIANNPNVCTPRGIMAQFGQPMGVSRTDTGSLVLLYRQPALRLAQ